MADIFICLICGGSFGVFAMLFTALTVVMAYEKKVGKSHKPTKTRYKLKQQKEIK